MIELLHETRMECTKDGSDKAYILQLRKMEGGQHELVAVWGKRGNENRVQIKATGTRLRCEGEADVIIAEKRRKGYVVVEISENAKAARALADAQAALVWAAASAARLAGG